MAGNCNIEQVRSWLFRARMFFTRAFLITSGVFVALPGSWCPAMAADGNLDPTFGTGGKVVTDFNKSTDWLNRIAVQPDGRSSPSAIPTRATRAR
jgi:hypothetical protein